jgi:hypothetical protein
VPPEAVERGLLHVWAGDAGLCRAEAPADGPR